MNGNTSCLAQRSCRQVSFQWLHQLNKVQPGRVVALLVELVARPAEVLAVAVGVVEAEGTNQYAIDKGPVNSNFH